MPANRPGRLGAPSGNHVTRTRLSSRTTFGGGLSRRLFRHSSTAYHRPERAGGKPGVVGGFV